MKQALRNIGIVGRKELLTYLGSPMALYRNRSFPGCVGRVLCQLPCRHRLRRHQYRRVPERRSAPDFAVRRAPDHALGGRREKAGHVGTHADHTGSRRGAGCRQVSRQPGGPVRHAAAHPLLHPDAVDLRRSRPRPDCDQLRRAAADRQRVPGRRHFRFGGHRQSDRFGSPGRRHPFRPVGHWPDRRPGGRRDWGGAHATVPVRLLRRVRARNNQHTVRRLLRHRDDLLPLCRS